MLKIIMIIALSGALALPAQAEEPSMLDGLAAEMMTRLFNLLTEDIAELGADLPEIPGYHLPEILPNGDIIIRRKQDALPPPKDGEIDL